jgi:hypothetical protein
VKEHAAEVEKMLRDSRAKVSSVGGVVGLTFSLESLGILAVAHGSQAASAGV